MLHEAPDTLAEPERELWAKTVQQFEFADDAALALLRNALEAHQLARECWEAIQQDGLTHKGKPHPLLVTLRDARKAFAAIMRQLDLEPVERRPPGRPPAYVGKPLEVVKRRG